MAKHQFLNMTITIQDVAKDVEYFLIQNRSDLVRYIEENTDIYELKDSCDHEFEGGYSSGHYSRRDGSDYSLLINMVILNEEYLYDECQTVIHEYIMDHADDIVEPYEDENEDIADEMFDIINKNVSDICYENIDLKKVFPESVVREIVDYFANELDDRNDFSDDFDDEYEDYYY